MIEKGVKFFWFFSTLLLTGTYALVWFRFAAAPRLGGVDPLQLHFATAIPCTLFQFLTALGVLFYFIGTGVWIKDQAMANTTRNRARAEALFAIYKRANKLKGHAFPFVTFAIFFGIMTFVLGGARQVEAVPLWLHPLVATLFLGVSIASFPFIYPAIDRNVAYLDEASALLED